LIVSLPSNQRAPLARRNYFKSTMKPNQISARGIVPKLRKRPRVIVGFMLLAGGLVGLVVPFIPGALLIMAGIALVGCYFLRLFASLPNRRSDRSNREPYAPQLRKAWLVLSSRCRAGSARDISMSGMIQDLAVGTTEVVISIAQFLYVDFICRSLSKDRSEHSTNHSVGV
jgi:hypothetical protein